MLKDKYMGKIRQVQVMSRYVVGFGVGIEYKKFKYVYDFLYGEMFSRAKIFILSLFMKRRAKKVKKTAKNMKIIINGSLHFI